MKTIRIQKNGSIKEAMSFENIDYIEVAECDDWFDSRLYELFSSRFMFVLFLEHYAEYVFTSSDYRGLRYLQQIHPGVDLLMITSKPCNAETIDLALALGIKRIGCTMDGTSRQAVKKAHDKGLIVSLWPGYSPDDFMLGAYLGADFMCTDIPVQLKKFQTEKAPWLKVIY